MNYTQILVKPLISEKAHQIKETDNQVVFYVAPHAGKIEIKRAVEEAFKVKVDAVNIVKRRPLARTRQGRRNGHYAGYKKAYVTLAAGSSIEFFEGV